MIEKIRPNRVELAGFDINKPILSDIHPFTYTHILHATECPAYHNACSSKARSNDREVATWSPNFVITSVAGHEWWQLRVWMMLT